MTALERAIGYGVTPSYEEVLDEVYLICSFPGLSEKQVALLLDVIACEGRFNMKDPIEMPGVCSPEEMIKRRAKRAIVEAIKPT